MSDAETFVRGANELPVMPPIAAEVVKKAEDPDSDLNALAQLISRDASLAVRVLKIANSSFYAMPRRIETIQQAIVLMGYSTLRSVVVAASIKDVFARFGLAERLLWEHAVAGGCAASVLAKRVAGLAPDEAFVAGLLHDIGKLLMHSEAERKYQEVMRAVYAEEVETIQAELDVFGFHHAQVGRLILERWGLPERLVDAVGAHHDIELAQNSNGGKMLAAVLSVADQICLLEGHGRRRPNPDLKPFEGPAAALLGVKAEEAESLLETFRESHEAEREIFS